MKTITSLAFVAMLSLLGSCTINPHPMDMTQAVQSARTRSDHDALAKHYEDAAKEMQVKVEEHKKLLAGYEGNTRFYTGFARTFTNEHEELVAIYERAVAANMRMAEAHRQMAAEAK
jgi:hypothetical protein